MFEPVNAAAPHACPECGEPSYIGFSVPARCINKACRNYDMDLWVDYIMAAPDPGDPEEQSPLPSPPVPTGMKAFAKAGNTYRDFCSHCHIPSNFHRYVDQGGAYHGYCPQCGKANHWAAPDWDDDADTDPQWSLDTGD